MALPRETRAGTARLSIQKETQDRTTISMVGKYVCSMKKKMCLRRMKLMNRRLYQPDKKKRDTSINLLLEQQACGFRPDVETWL